MILRNPTENKIAVSIFGKEYSVEGLGTVEVSEKVGEYWRKSIHLFLELMPENKKEEVKSEPVVEEKAEEAEEAVASEEVKKPRKGAKK